MNTNDLFNLIDKKEVFLMNKRIPLLPTIFLILLWSSFLLFPLHAETNPSFLQAVREFDEFVKKQIEKDQAPGISVGFLKDNFIWTKGYGYSDLENNVEAKPESSYRLASITKTITAIAVLQLVEEGKIDLDAKVQTYVPYFPKKKWPVTTRLLLGHLGGISHYKNYEREGHIKTHKNTKQALDIFDDFDLMVKPGTEYHYSSYGYNLLGAVIEGATGVSYGEYIKENIFEPLGMDNSRMDDPVDLIPHRVEGYRLINGEIKNSEYVDVSSRFAAGGTRSTVEDLLKYADQIIKGELLKEVTWKKMFTSMTTTKGHLTGYGMGWGVRPWKGHFRVSHGGSQPETRTYLLFFPTEHFAVAIGSNLEHVSLMPYVRRLAELVLDEDLHTQAYVNDENGQILYDASQQTYSYGLSQYDWKGRPTAQDNKELQQAFDYFNKYVQKKSLEKNFKKTKNKIEDGIHPVSDQAFTKVGSYMASCLIPQKESSSFEKYRKGGPLSFFKEYIHQEGDSYGFSDEFARLILSYERDWKTTYTAEIRDLRISKETDFQELGPWLKVAFAQKTVYPDFTGEMSRVGRHFLGENKYEKSIQIFNLARELYPLSSSPVSGLAAAHLWTGNKKKARTLFQKAFEMDPSHYGVSLDAFDDLAQKLTEAHKVPELLALVEIAVGLYPEDAQLHARIGDLYRELGKRKKALSFYKKALNLDPELEEVKEKIKKLRKK